MKQSPANIASSETETSGPKRFGWWVTLVVSLLYCLWLGAHWLPLDFSDKELAASASRVWDIQRELAEHARLPWWTPYFMSGSSYGLNYARGFYLVPWLMFSNFFGLLAGGKLMALTAMFTGAVAMYFCVRHFLRNEWAATLGALAFLFHPEQIIRAAGAEHMTISLFFPFIPLLWLTFARALESQKFRDAFWCALVVAGAMWTDNKQAFVHFVFLTGYIIYWLWPKERRRLWPVTVKTCALIGVVSLGLSAAFVLPGLVESKYVKLFAGDPIKEWQKSYSFKSLFGIVDRNGIVTTAAREGVVQAVQRRGGVGSKEELEKVQRLFLAGSTDSPEKYAGLVWLALVAVTALFNYRRQDRWLFWMFVALTMLSVMLGTGVTNVWSANFTTLGAWFGLSGVPGGAKLAGFAALAAVAGFFALFWKRKLTSQRKMIIAGAALVLFLFVPAFQILGALPLFKEIRAPYVFYDGPEVFLGAMLVAFFVTDVLTGDKWAKYTFQIVGAVSLLMLIDYWPYQKPMKDNGVPPRTLQNLRTSYAALKQDQDWVKTYSVSGRYFHLLGPVYCNKPQVYEAFYNWMSPLGTGLLNQQAFSSWENHRAFLNLFAARYVVFDKSDPNNAQQGTQQVLAAYRQTYPVVLENDDFVIFRNEAAHAYVTGFGRACLFIGDIRATPQLALALAAKNWPLEHTTKNELPKIPTDRLRQFERIYVRDTENLDLRTIPADLQPRISIVREGVAPLLPVSDGSVVTLNGTQLTRERPGIVRLRFTAPAACLAVIAESFYPFWKVEVDGLPVEVRRISCGLMGVSLDPGAHEVVLRYQPPIAYLVAAMVSVGLLLGCLGIIIFSARGSATTRPSGADPFRE